MSSLETSQNIILEILKKRGLLSGSSTRVVSGFMTKWSVDAFHAVLETHVLEETHLADILSEEYRLQRVLRLHNQSIDKAVLELIPYRLAMEWEAMAYAREPDGRIHIAVADPSQQPRIEELARRLHAELIVAVAERSEIEACIQRHYPLSMQLPLTMSECGYGKSSEA